MTMKSLLKISITCMVLLAAFSFAKAQSVMSLVEPSTSIQQNYADKVHQAAIANAKAEEEKYQAHLDALKDPDKADRDEAKAQEAAAELDNYMTQNDFLSLPGFNPTFEPATDQETYGKMIDEIINDETMMEYVRNTDQSVYDDILVKYFNL